MTFENVPLTSKETVKCNKCGLISHSKVKFCPNCGTKTDDPVSLKSKLFPSLAFLHFTGSAYLILTVAVNPLVQASILFSIPYILIGMLGLFVGLLFYFGKLVKGWTKSLSVIIVCLGTLITIVVYIIGFRIERLIGPAWVIFLINGWALVKDWRRL
jgi:hypothetical protein